MIKITKKLIKDNKYIIQYWANYIIALLYVIAILTLPILAILDIQGYINLF